MSSKDPKQADLPKSPLANSESQNDQSLGSDSTNGENSAHPIKRLLVFQVKLAFDAIRDILLSPISLVATLIDLVENNRGKKSYFNLLLKYGRESERRINLFEQTTKSRQAKTVDSVVQQVEDILIKEYRNGEISEKARVAIEKTLKLKAAKIKQKSKTTTE